LSGFQVEVQTRFLDQESDPEADRYVFAYTITIVNGGEAPGKLLQRHWVITDGSGHIEEVRGAGVIGEQPHIKPGESYRYTSGAVIKTPVGSMEGSYHFARDDSSDFEVAIPAFLLSVPNMVH
jgi:ApaG protein